MPRGVPNQITEVILYGKCRWAKLFSPSMYGKWSIELNLDNESLSKVLELKKKGIKNQIKKDDDGYWIVLSRATEYNKGGKKVGMSPPIVVNNEGQPWDKSKGIGNDSDVAVKVQVREYTVPNSMPGASKGIAAKLEAVKIINLVPFEAKKDYDEEEQIQIKGLEEAEPKPW